jgi:hypothetical protein
MPTVIIHIANEDPVVGDLDALPGTTDSVLIVKNPRKRDGKDVPYIDVSVSTVIWPMTRVSFIEVLPVGEEEEIITFVREQ